jgi:hypothetical protein
MRPDPGNCPWLTSQCNRAILIEFIAVSYVPGHGASEGADRAVAAMDGTKATTWGGEHG